MALTGAQLLTAFSEFLDDYFASTTTSGGTTTTVVDTTLQRFGEKANEEAFVRITEESATPGNLYLVRRITNFTGSTLTVAPAFAQAVDSGINYELHRWEPAKKFRALDRARILAFPQIAMVVYDETLTSDGVSTELDIPASIRRGPAYVYAEDPLNDTNWNLLTNPKLDSTTGWTATSVTAAAYARSINDHLVPKLENACVKLTSGASGNYSQALGSTLASAMAGRKFSFGCWVYSLTPGCTVGITDDAATAVSDAHNGDGWEFLQVTRNVSGTNATTLTVKITPGTNNAVFVERAYAGQIARIPLSYTNFIPRDAVHRDDDDATLHIQRPAPRGYQYRLVGRKPVSQLGTSTTLQATNTMEVTEYEQDLLLATAARVLLTWEGMSSGEIDKSFPQIQLAEQRFKELSKDWERKYPRNGYLETWATG